MEDLTARLVFGAGDQNDRIRTMLVMIDIERKRIDERELCGD